MSKKRATVIGAGISGLTTAVLLQKEYKVTIIARNFPGELKSEYASPWLVNQKSFLSNYCLTMLKIKMYNRAGAHWRSDAKPEDTRQQDFDRETFNHFWNLANTKPSETGIMVVDGFDYWDEHSPMEWKDPWFKDLCPEYRHLTKKELPTGVEFGTTYKTITINPPKHLDYLLASFYALGGTIKRASLTHIQEAIFNDTDILINCSGLGSRTLGGVLDQSVHPASGQTVLVQLPIGHVNWTFGRYAAGRTDGGTHRKNESLTYVIPRDNGEVILGGTFCQDDYSTIPDTKIADAIISRCLSTRPDLLPTGETKLNIKRHGVESEKAGKRILLCHNYGHGGYGWQSSYGASKHVIQILKQAYKEDGENKKI
ncbi:9525_t:CDS:2 [Scutellospora calospora]|uniref:9525_t:CDS:1 n=1 Tax=Scutellospora calospora TaxID=85575 RepID=A0ACA9KUQ1_9GLOM|nr:9525_t:CDS:2 [Scutellospora calospora]